MRGSQDGIQGKIEEKCPIRGSQRGANRDPRGDRLKRKGPKTGVPINMAGIKIGWVVWVGKSEIFADEFQGGIGEKKIPRSLSVEQIKNIIILIIIRILNFHEDNI